MATEMGGEIIRVNSSNIAESILEEAEKMKVTTIYIGKPHISLFRAR